MSLSSAEKHSEKHLLQVAENLVKKKTSSTNIMCKDAETEVPKFRLSELTVGKVLGRGSFSKVCEIEKISVKKASGANQNPEDDGDEHHHDDMFQDRDFIANNCLRNGKDCRYAIKVLQDHMRQDPNLFVRSLVDLVIETRFLSVVKHPHIIKMRAVSAYSPYTEGKHYFVVLDRLYEILSMRLAKSWKKKMPGALSLVKNTKAQKAFWAERLAVSYDISTALTYLHGLNVVYRDIKPDNIGFDVRGDVKLFDFGLAKELKPNKRADDGTFKLTEDVGSLRYMAPEVALGKPYNETCDCYSFSILLWQILKVETPYELYDRQASFQNKVVRKGVRPRCDPKWPENLVETMKSAWGVDISKRPSMEDMTKTLSNVLVMETGEERSQGLDNSRHSLRDIKSALNENNPAVESSS